MKFIERIKNKINLYKTFQKFKRIDSIENRFKKYVFNPIEENFSNTFDRHYIYHTAWASRILKQIDPSIHIDIGSSLYFISILSSFYKIIHYDYYPPLLRLDNVETKHANLLSLPFKTNSIYSLSCMHVVEHVGLGRYGDPIDFNGDITAINEIKRVIATNGHLLFVVPIGSSSLHFNAHRIYDAEWILNQFKDFELKNFSLIPDNNELGLIESPSLELCRNQNYACGCFYLIKK